MKKAILFCFLALGLLSCSKPVATFYDDQGNTVNFVDYRGKWIVINYWASWCASCLQEIPELNTLATTQKNVVIYGVNYDAVSNEAQLQKIVQRLNIKFPTLLTDPATYFGVKHIPALPATLLIDPQGNLKKILLGAQTQQSLMRDMH